MTRAEAECHAYCQSPGQIYADHNSANAGAEYL